MILNESFLPSRFFYEREFAFLFQKCGKYNSLLLHSLDFNYYGSWKVIETMDQKLVE